MKVGILGNGSRENAIKNKIREEVIIFSSENEIKNIDFLIVSMEKYLVDGIVDRMKIPVFGPTKEASKIEGSKIFSKTFMKENNISTSSFIIPQNKQEAFNFLQKNFKKDKKYVIKLDGLASGKGVFLPDNLEDSLKIINNIEEDYLIEERIYGEEVSIMGFCNGKDIELMPQIKDYKRIYDNDLGPNTGGMGAIGPVNILTTKQIEEVKKDMLKVVKKLNYKGILYGGLIKDKNNYYFLEFNCRFGDPETQVVLNLLDNDLLTIMEDCIKGNKLNVKWNNNFSANVVLSHTEYPFSKIKNKLNIEIGNLDKDIEIFWSSKTTASRVASIVHTSNNLYFSLNKIYNNIFKIKYDNRYYRKDIGYKYLLDNIKKTDKNLKLAILSSSKGTSLEKLLDKNLINLIVTNKKTKILENNVPIIYLPKIDYNILINILESFEIDIIFAVGFMEIIPKHFCDYYQGKLFNIHPSLLPDYGKMFSDNIHQKIIKNKELFSGCTLHQITENIDSGKIVLQKQIKIETKDYKILKEQIQKLEKDILFDFFNLYQNKSITYKDSGVDIKKGNDFVKNINKGIIGSFCSINNINGVKIATSTDGVGTKLELAREYNKYDEIGIDLVAMSVNDLIVRGAKPKLFLDYIAINKINQEILVKIIDGIKKGCSISNCQLVGGETAEMSNVYKNNGFDLAGFAMGIIEKDVYPKINKIKKGLKIYGLKSNGIHSNGFSLVRKLLKLYNYDINILMKPTKIYVECFDIIDKYNKNLLAMAHITGGGLIGNIKRILPINLELKINIKIKNEFLWIMEKGNLNYHEMISTFNCGYGMALIFDEDFKNEENFDIIGEIK